MAKFSKKKSTSPEELLRDALDSAITNMQMSGSLTGYFSKSDANNLVKALKNVLEVFKVKSKTESTKILNEVISGSGTLRGKPKAEKLLRDLFDQAREESGLKKKEDDKRNKLLRDINKSAKDFNDSTSKNLDALNDKMGIRGYLERKDKPFGRFLEVYEQIKKRDNKQGFSPIALIKTFGESLSNSKIFKFLGFSLGWFGRWPALLGYQIGSIFEDYKKHNADAWDSQKEYYKQLLEEGNTKKDIKAKMQSLPGGLKGDDFNKMAREAFGEYMIDANNIFRAIASDLALSKYKTPEGQAKIIERAQEAGLGSGEVLKLIKSENRYMRELVDLMKEQTTSDETDDNLEIMVDEFKLFREDYLRELNEKKKNREEKGSGIFSKLLNMIPGLRFLGGLLGKGGPLVKGLMGLSAGALGIAIPLTLAAAAGYKFGQWLDKTYRIGDRLTNLLLGEPESKEDAEKRDKRLIELNKKWQVALSKGDKEEINRINKEKQDVIYGAEIERTSKENSVIKTINILSEERAKKDKKEKERLNSIIQQKSINENKPISINTSVPSRLDTVPGHVEDIALRTFSEGFLR